MVLELKQQLKMSQQLVMTPQLQMAIKLLQLSRQELSEMIQQEMVENPVLEEIPEPVVEGEAKIVEAEAKPQEDRVRELDVTTTDTNSLSDIDWENYAERYTTSYRSGNDDEERPAFENTLVKKTSLAEHLIWQLQLSNFMPEERLFATQIIYDLDDDGRLTSPLEELAAKSQVSVEFAEQVLKKVQEFDPVGVAARDLKECLLIQARYLELGKVAEMVEEIISHHLPNLEKRNFRAIAKDLGISIEDVIEATKAIHEMEPKPGRPFSGGDPQYITPDIYIYKVSDEYVVVLNDDGMPKLRISPLYREVLLKKGESGQNTKNYIREKLQSAAWLIRSIHQWQRTIYKVTKSIIKFQREFLDKGIPYLKPLVLRDVAEDIGMHESTVSRVTTNKYVHTPQGIFELKYFFNSGISSADGDIASESVKKKILQLINIENPKNRSPTRISSSSLPRKRFTLPAVR